MSEFKYLVVNAGSAEREVCIEAKTAADARRLLRRQGYVPVKQVAAGFMGVKTTWRPFRRKFNVYNFTNRLAPLLEANIPLEKSLSVIEESTTEQREIDVIRQIRKGLHEGKRFSMLTREMSEHFSPLYSSLIETGEESGCLPQIAKELRRFLKESKEFRDFIITSSIYPLLVVTVTFGVIILMFTVFIPRFARIFSEMGREMPLMTRIMLKTGEFMQATWFIWPILIAGIIFLCRLAKTNESVKSMMDTSILKVPLLKDIIKAVQVARFIRTLSIMVKNHVHLLRALRISGGVVGNSVISGSISGVEEKLRAGTSLSEILGKNVFMPEGTGAMLRIAEESGNVGEMLERIASESEDDTRVKVKRLLALMEPVIILLLALIVLLVVLSIFLAIMEMNAIK